jgi:hypothetical protein
MRTLKALACVAAVAAGVATSMAQSNVYSLNVVGYYNITVNAGQKVLIANQLNTTNNTIGSVLIPQPNDQFFKFNGGFTAYNGDSYTPGVWDPNGLATLNPGEGGFYIPAVATTITFVGEVLQGSLTNTLPINTKVIRSSIVPQAGAATGALGLPVEPNDQLFTFNGGYTAYNGDSYSPGTWDPSDPQLVVGQAFFYIKANGGVQSNWVRNFTVQ